MKSQSDIELFDSNGTLTSEAIVRYKAKKLSENQSKVVRSYIEHSSLGKEAVETFNPANRSELHKLNKRIENVLESKISSLDSANSGSKFKMTYILIGVILIVLSYLLFSML